MVCFERVQRTSWRRDVQVARFARCQVSKEKYDKLFNVLSKLINKCLGIPLGSRCRVPWWLAPVARYGESDKDMPYNPEGTETEAVFGWSMVEPSTLLCC